MKAKQIGSYSHGAVDQSVQDPDTKPGAYYVTARDQGRTSFLLGPFVDDHAAALAAVDRARGYVQANYPRAAWWAFGTCRMDTAESNPIGRLNGIVLMVEAA